MRQGNKSNDSCSKSKDKKFLNIKNKVKKEIYEEPEKKKKSI
jgi:hypothetical protein